MSASRIATNFTDQCVAGDGDGIAAGVTAAGGLNPGDVSGTPALINGGAPGGFVICTLTENDFGASFG